jgi:hypothetical protein
MIAVIGTVLALSALSYTDASGTTSRLQVQVSDNVLFLGDEPMVGWIDFLHFLAPRRVPTSYLRVFCTKRPFEALKKNQSRC